MLFKDTNKRIMILLLMIIIVSGLLLIEQFNDHAAQLNSNFLSDLNDPASLQDTTLEDKLPDDDRKNFTLQQNTPTTQVPPPAFQPSESSQQSHSDNESSLIISNNQNNTLFNQSSNSSSNNRSDLQIPKENQNDQTNTVSSKDISIDEEDKIIPSNENSRSGDKCSVIVSPNEDLQKILDSDAEVICLTAGKFTKGISRGPVVNEPHYALRTDGPKRLVYTSDGVNVDSRAAWEIPESERATIPGFGLTGTNWTVRGLNVEWDQEILSDLENQPGRNTTLLSMTYLNGDNSLIEKNIFQFGGKHSDDKHINLIKFSGNNSGIEFSRNLVTAPFPVLDGPDPGLESKAYTGIRIADNTRNALITKNEFRDVAGDAIQFSIDRTDTDERSGIKITHNEMYITPRLHIDCINEKGFPGNKCACAENAIDTKHVLTKNSPLLANQNNWLQFENNLIYGYRKAERSCGADGSQGAAIAYPASADPRGMLITDNWILDSQRAINVLSHDGSDMIFRDNLIVDVWEIAFHIISSDQVQITNNTVTAKDPYEFLSPSKAARWTTKWLDVKGAGNGQLPINQLTIEDNLFKGEGRVKIDHVQQKEFDNNIVLSNTQNSNRINETGFTIKSPQTYSETSVCRNRLNYSGSETRQICINIPSS